MIEHGIETFRAKRLSDMIRVDRLEETMKDKKQLMITVKKHLKLNTKPVVDKVQIPTINDIFNHKTRFQAKPTVHYWTHERNVPIRPNEPQNEPNPFKVALDTLKDLAGDPIKSKSTASKGFRRKSYLEEQKLNGCVVNQKLARLQVPTPPVPIGKYELEKTFFSDVEGRPIKENFQSSSFKNAQRSALFPMLLNGYCQDEIFRRKEQHRLDLDDLEKIKEELETTRKVLDRFKAQTHNESIDLVQQHLTIEQIKEVVLTYWHSSRGMLSEIKSTLHKYDFKLSELLLCRDLLLKLSPTTFQLEYAASVRMNPRRYVIMNDVISRFSDYCRYNPDPGVDYFLDELVDTFIRQLQSLGPQTIYFKEGWEIDVVMRRMELSCVRQLADLVDLNRKIQELKTLQKHLHRYHTSTLNALKRSASEERSNIKSLKIRAAKLGETANNDVNTFYKQLCAGDYVLETMALVEVLHGDFFGSSRQKLDHISMLSDIEGEMRRVQIEIQNIDGPTYERYEKMVKLRLTAKNITEPLNAREKFRLAKNHMKRVNTTYSKSLADRTWKIPLRRSRPILHPVAHLNVTAGGKKSRGGPPANYLQLTGIADKDDVEMEINKLFENTMLSDIKESESSEGSTSSETQQSHLRSSIVSESLRRGLISKASSIYSGSSMKLLDLDYDSEEKLIRNNVEKLKAKKLIEDVPPILYDVKPLDDRFMVGTNLPRTTPRNVRCKLRGEPKKTTALSWR